MFKIYIHYLIDIQRSRYFFRKLNFSINCDQHFSSKVFIYVLLNYCLSVTSITRNMNWYIDLHLFIKSINFWLTHKLHSISLNPLIPRFSLFVEFLLINLQAKVTVKTLLLLILNRSIHEVFSLRFRILD